MIPNVFRGGGAVGEDLAAVDWAATALGDPDSWPRSLSTVVRALLSSRFSMWMAWGPDLTFFCNDAYRHQTLADKYPWALGRPASEVWAEIWPDIGPRIETVMRTGTATWDEALLLFLERSGYREESYHTFSYSPLSDDDGVIVGMLCVVSEETERVIGERRLATLRDLGSDPTAVRTEAEVVDAACRHLANASQLVPFTLIYRYEEDGTARLAGTAGLDADHPAAPATIGPDELHPAWPAAALLRGESVVVGDLGHRFPDLPTGGWDQPPEHAFVVPLPQQGFAAPYGFAVAGLNRYRPFDAGYRSFVDLVAGHIAAGIASARAYEQERHRAERLAEVDRAKTAFFTNISHEFRTPLTLLLGPAEDALTDGSEPLGPVQHSRVEIVHRNAQRLMRLVNSLLDFSRLEAGSLAPRREPLELASYTEELARSFVMATDRVGLTLDIECPPLPQEVWVDAEMWAKIVLNLLSNALKFTFEGSISVSLKPDQDDPETVVLSVADTGIGIEPDEQRHLFERFHRVAGARSRTHEGSGIGLALVAELVALHGGTVDVTSTPGAGSTFRVRLPLSVPQAVDEARVPAEVAPAAEPYAQHFVAEAMKWNGQESPVLAEPTEPGRPAVPEVGPEPGRRPLVLVADDNADMREYVTQLLATRYDIVTAADGMEALDAVRTHRPDLVLSDVMMPRMDGFELVRALRADPDTASVPVVLLSARAGEESTVEGLDAGADDYLVKPFAARELLARVRANLELDRVRRMRKELERRQVLLDQAQRLAKVGSWEIDLNTSSVSASTELLRQLQLDPQELRERGFDYTIEQRAHPADREEVRTAIHAAIQGRKLDFETRMLAADGEIHTFHIIGELEYDESGRPARLRGSQQDITEQKLAQEALAVAAAAREAADREHRIANELQASLLPPPSFDPEQLRVATYYRAGVEGTQVGGDWFDVIELGAGRTALVLGDVMGRGVRAAAVMGQLRSAVRAYARLDLPPADVLEHLDAVVRDLGADHIVTCVYAVYDPGERRLVYANAGHLPPLLRVPGEPTRLLDTATEPPLGTGLPATRGGEVVLPAGAMLVLYTDGLVENREQDLDEGIARLCQELDRLESFNDSIPDVLVRTLLPEGHEDDVAILIAHVEQGNQDDSLTIHVASEDRAVRRVRDQVTGVLRAWDVSPALQEDVVLLTSELTTNAIVYGSPPIELRLRDAAGHFVLEVFDSAAYLPRRLRPTPDDEHGRGLQLVAMLAEQWGTRPTERGKAVWCVIRKDRLSATAEPLAGEF